jgi:hypothetical protein
LKEGIDIQLHHAYCNIMRVILPLYQPLATINLP